jgi:8-oxo-dGTP pyrophosphatase MutT (NUDIX family)
MSEPEYVIPYDRLPERIAEALERPPAVPVPARPAATIVLLRDAPLGVEVLLTRRSRQAGFVPGAWVFPGGRVDGSDATVDVISRLDGLDAGEAATRLRLPDADPPAIAYYLAALREAFEETGILVGIDDQGRPPATAAESTEVDEVRVALLEDRIGFAEALARLRCRIAGDSIEYFAHWVTPEAEPRRYDTRFFAARVAEGAEAVIDPREMTDAIWLTAREALERVAAGTLPMIFPTIKTLTELAPWASTVEALGAIGRAPVRTRMPRLVRLADGVGMKLDDED